MKPSRTEIQRLAKQYLKIVEWSDEDGCYIGSAPPLVGQSCHGATEAEVLKQLKVIVEEWVEILLTDGKPLPKAISDREFSGKFVVRLTPDEHKRVALRALARGESLNQYVAEALSRA